MYLDERVMYIAMPTRLKERAGEFAEFAFSKGYAPFNHFASCPYHHFEGGLLSRNAVLALTFNIQRICGTTGIFGISDGVMRELDDRLKWDSERNIRVFYGLDPEWDKMYAELSKQYGDLLAKLRGPYRFIALVGPSAIGKSFWIDRLCNQFKSRLQIVRNTTTRLPRNERDEDYYKFTSRTQFEEGIRTHQFLEHDQYLGNYYGSSLKEIKRVLSVSHGIAAFTPKGVAALHDCRFEINFSVLVFRPTSSEVLVRNLERRGDDPKTFQAKLEKAKDFVVAHDIPHQEVEITGDLDADDIKVYLAIDKLLNS